MTVCRVQELQALEEAAWASPERRALYSTCYVPGFPWHTVQGYGDPSTPASPASALARRHVVPYDYPFTVFVKGRWVGRKLLDVYAEDLPHHTPAYYEACLRTGRLRCVQRRALGQHNTQRRLLKRSSAPVVSASPASRTAAEEGKESASVNAATAPSQSTSNVPDARASADEASAAAGLNVVLQHGDVVYHTVHRHEVPVAVGTSGVDAVHITAVRIAKYGLICINKPTGLPTHATGRYLYNSLTAMLEYVLAPRRLHAWLINEDPLLQSLVSTVGLSSSERQELYAYYRSPSADHPNSGSCVAGETKSEGREVDPSKLPRPCHRLDKVTSGVLLLAVHQDAAKRIGTVLMQKAKEVDEAVTAELKSATSPDCMDTMESRSAGTAAASPPPLPSSLQRMLARTYELQKYYLARVVGAFDNVNQKEESATLGSNTLAGTAWQLSGTEAYLKHHNDAVRSLLSTSAGLCGAADLTDADSNELPKPSNMFPGGLLTTAPISTHKRPPAHEFGGAELDKSTESAPLDRTRHIGDEKKDFEARRDRTSKTANLSAATLCQSLCSAEGLSSVLTAAQNTSLVLCTPYTGRLHQIRCHLSSLGCPIAGDAVYAPATRSDGLMADRETGRPASDAGGMTTAEEACHASARHERGYIYFDATQLPAAYRSSYPEKSSQALQETAAPAATIGIKRDRAYADGPGSTSASAWQLEPQCYECAGRLPILATQECATGASAICLHAWAYEVKESLLLQDAAQAEAPQASKEGVVHNALRADRNAGALRQAGGVRAIEDGFVRFEAPPPAWACTAHGSTSKFE
ncbi:hypothetical protein ABL78_7732 [Leptomonas seymouri]|uniref:Pseudouridine synthase RsuA/RluA-like domain-containing protein n=1 Tax=Leptomonas seymouri TaxID=5684 RepID=A0A0N1IHN9_LEPSE|nr:hypothetical protein ABL78_7732 [Leptomonas seymouri]|eukprot:KPI83242.1 hypothetical protein ABL78_7732 [Leptomonas seymouri]